MGYWRDLFSREEWAKIFDNDMTRFEKRLETVALPEDRQDVRDMAILCAQLGLRPEDLQPMVRYWRVHPVRCDARHAWDEGYRSGISPTAYAAQNPHVGKDRI